MNRLLAEACCQKAALLIVGGDVDTCAGIETDTVVSDTSMLGWAVLLPVQRTEQVADEPCDAGGAQISIRFTFTLPMKEVTVVFVTVPTVPAAQRRLLGVMPVAAPLDDKKR